LFPFAILRALGLSSEEKIFDNNFSQISAEKNRRPAYRQAGFRKKKLANSQVHQFTSLLARLLLIFPDGHKDNAVGNINQQRPG